jgi:DNA-binding CsgD family transcriptional regulator
LGKLEFLIDQIYDAALFPERWSRALHSIDMLMGSATTSLQARRADAWVGWAGSPGAEAIRERYFASSAATESRTPRLLLGMARAGFVADHELMPEEDYLADSLMSGFGTAAGLHHAAATAILVPGGDAAVVQVWRAAGQPRFGAECLRQLDTLRPHLARAAMLSTRLRLKQMQAATETLELLGIPAAVVEASGRVVAANDLMQAMRGHFLWLAGDQLAFSDRIANGLFREELARSAATGLASARSFVSRGSGDQNYPAIVHVVPLKTCGRELFNGAWFLLAVNKPGAATLDGSLLQGLFDFTAAEARVAAGLLEGLSVKEMSRRYGVSVLTLRTQVKSVLAKSGSTRQPEFIARLRGTALRPAQ